MDAVPQYVVYDFSTYVFHAFARYVLAGGQLTDTQKSVLRDALSVLTERLRRDAADAGLDAEEIGRIYPTLENMGSLALDMLLGEDVKVDGTIVRHNLRRLARYASTDVPATLRNRTLDSNLDRIRKMLEGWLLQIECALYRREQGWPIPDYVTESFGISNS
jgi:hypothetical protein